MASRLFSAILIGSTETEMRVYELSQRKGMKQIDHVSTRIGLGSDAYSDGRLDSDILAELVRVLRESAPPSDSDPLSQENLTWLTAVLDCLTVMDERLYEHYRAMIDLFRAGVFRADREKLLAYPSWNALRIKGVQLGFLPEDLYGEKRSRPHLGLPDEYVRRKEAAHK